MASQHQGSGAPQYWLENKEGNDTRKALKLKNLMRNLSLIGAGGFMAILILLPLTTSAEDGDEQTDFIPPTNRAENHAIRAI